MEQLAFGSADEFEAWLEAKHETCDGLWLKLAKKDSGIESIVYKEAVEVALCFGWIDGQAKRLDDDWYLQRFTPRRKRSRWSRINTERAEKLIASGRMRPAGLAEVEEAKADGRWDAAYEPPSTIEVPDDLRRELDKNPAARESFENLDGQNRYAVLYRIQDAKRPETRARRIGQFVQMLARGEKLHS